MKKKELIRICLRTAIEQLASNWFDQISDRPMTQRTLLSETRRRLKEMDTFDWEVWISNLTGSELEGIQNEWGTVDFQKLLEQQ